MFGGVFWKPREDVIYLHRFTISGIWKIVVLVARLNWTQGQGQRQRQRQRQS